MNTRIKREEVATLLIKDKFFAKGNRRLKIKQWIVAILGWCGVIFPFVWVTISFRASMKGRGLQWHSFRKNEKRFLFCCYF